MKSRKGTMEKAMHKSVKLGTLGAKSMKPIARSKTRMTPKKAKRMM